MIRHLNNSGQHSLRTFHRSPSLSSRPPFDVGETLKLPFERLSVGPLRVHVVVVVRFVQFLKILRGESEASGYVEDFILALLFSPSALPAFCSNASSSVSAAHQ